MSSRTWNVLFHIRKEWATLESSESTEESERQHPQENPKRGLHSIFHGPEILP